MGNEAETESGTEAAAPAVRRHRTLRGTLVANGALVARIGHAAFLCRLVYNAAIDPDVPFAEGVAHRLAASAARRAGTESPPELARPAERPRFAGRQALSRELIALLAAHAELGAYGRSPLDHALADACEARSRHIAAVGEAIKQGRKPPRLHFRSADDGWTLSTSDFTLLRVGDGPAQQKPKAHHVTATTLRNRRRRENLEIHREVAWAENKRRCGWDEDRVAAGLARRADRQRADRERQRGLEAERQAREAASRAAGEPRKVRRDSPSATLGQRRLKGDVLGLRRFRMDLGEPIPEGAETVTLHIAKPAWRGAKVEVGLVVTEPVPRSLHDHDTVRAALHALAAALPADATPMMAVEALRASGMLGRGEYLGVSAPSCDDTGRATAPVRVAKADMHAIAAAQRGFSHKETCRLKAAKGGAKGKVSKAHVPADMPKRGKAKRSRNALRALATVRSILHRAKERSRTRAYQDASALVAGAPVLVATDPPGMAKGLYAKGGPAERRAKRSAAERAAADAALFATPGTMPAPLPGAEAPLPFRLSEAAGRSLRRNLHQTCMAFRARRTGTRCDRLGAVHWMPGHAGTTAGCPGCDRVRPKALSERRHVCPCGLDVPRDQASALMTLGRSVLAFRAGPDPGGLLAERRGREAAAKAAKRRAAMLAGAAKHVEARRKAKESAAADAAAHETGGAPPVDHRGVVTSPGHLADGKRKRVKNQGRNVRRSA